MQGFKSLSVYYQLNYLKKKREASTCVARSTRPAVLKLAYLADLL